MTHSTQYTNGGLGDVTGELSETSPVGHQKFEHHLWDIKSLGKKVNVLAYLPPEQPEKSLGSCSSCEGLSFDPEIKQPDR